MQNIFETWNSNKELDRFMDVQNRKNTQVRLNQILDEIKVKLTSKQLIINIKNDYIVNNIVTGYFIKDIRTSYLNSLKIINNDDVITNHNTNKVLLCDDKDTEEIVNMIKDKKQFIVYYKVINDEDLKILKELCNENLIKTYILNEYLYMKQYENQSTKEMMGKVYDKEYSLFITNI